MYQSDIYSYILSSRRSSLVITTKLFWGGKYVHNISFLFLPYSYFFLFCLLLLMKHVCFSEQKWKEDYQENTSSKVKFQNCQKMSPQITSKCVYGSVPVLWLWVLYCCFHFVKHSPKVSCALSPVLWSALFPVCPSPLRYFPQSCSSCPSWLLCVCKSCSLCSDWLWLTPSKHLY